jgi:hypothetical protein
VLRDRRKTTPPGPASGPFNLDDRDAYVRWRDHKLRAFPLDVEAQRVSIGALGPLNAALRDEIVGACRRGNFAIYRTVSENPPEMLDLRNFGTALGLARFDRHLWAPEQGIVALRKDYIPYTDRAMGWHTDGYYKTTDKAVRGVIMHCISPAAEGGANWLLDPEMVYIAMRDSQPRLVGALMQPDVMTVPENDQEPGARRAAVAGPVFSVSPKDGTLHMRYTARTVSIEWRNDPFTRDAVAFLKELLTPPVPYAYRVSLEAGEGIVCNNVLHNREAFRDDETGKRLLWRARYRDRIMGTGEWRDEPL